MVSQRYARTGSTSSDRETWKSGTPRPLPSTPCSRVLIRLGCRELQREKAWSRIHLVPLMLAEQDRDAYRRNVAAVAREREIMKDVPGWEVSAA